MRAERNDRWTRYLAAAGLLIVAGLVGAAELTLEKKGDRTDASIKLRTEVPSYRAVPGGHLYGGPYPPPQPYYYYFPYPYPPNPSAPAAAAPVPTQEARYDAGHIILLVDPVGAEVYLDELRLRQRDDLSYAVAVLEGRHLLRVAAQGYETYEKPIEVLGGRGAFLAVRLRPGRPEATPNNR